MGHVKRTETDSS